MSRWIRSTKDPAWSDLLSTYQKGYYRLEAQQVYSNPAENELLEQFRAGTMELPTFEWRLSRSQERQRAGCTQTWVRVVVEPPTDYTRMELALYPVLVKGGEDVRAIVVREGEWPEGLPTYDYYVFDERDVWRMHYHDDFTFAGAELLEGDDVLADHLRWRDLALAQAIPILEHPQLDVKPL